MPEKPAPDAMRGGFPACAKPVAQLMISAGGRHHAPGRS